jgi:hypothetical protein
MIRYTRWICATIVVALVASPLQAIEIFWQGGTGNLGDSNYTDGTNTGLAPSAFDVLDIGAGGTATYSVAGPTSFQKLRVGHIQGAVGVQGAGTVTINNGAAVTLSVGASGSANASLWVGNGQSGTLNIDGVGTSVASAQLIEIGYGSDLTSNATVNVTNGAALTATAGNINIGDRIGSSGVGIPGHLNVSGSGSSVATTGGADLNIGLRAGSSYLQSDGTVSIADQVNVGQNGAQNSSFTMSGGTLTAGGAVTVGDNTAHGSSFSVSGGTLQSASVTIGNLANNVTGSFTGNAVINIPTNNFNVGLGTSQNASVLIADNVDINIPNTASSTGNVFIGRDTSTGATFNMTGGTVDTGRNFLLGNATGATGIVGNQSGGTITTTLNFVVTDTNGASTYNLSGTGAIVSNGLMIVGRQTATGVMNQTGGSVTAALGVAVANAQSATTSTWGTGIYNVSGGTITANQTTGTALAIAPQGNSGTFRVIGDDATIDVNGNMTVNAGGGAQGTLAYQLETGDLLSQIDVSGNATFNAGAILSFDTSLATPTQSTYNVLTALDIIDSGITFNGPAGWNYQIIPGGNGEILQLFQPPASLLGDFNSDGKVDAGDYVTWRKNDGTNNALANDNGLGTPVGPAHYALWRANFGNPPASGSGLSSAQIPEPASVFLCFAAIAGLMFAQRR